MMNAEDAGALSSAGRFERMEQALRRIEDKLDAKADTSDFIELKSHVERIDDRLDKLERGGSIEAKQALTIANSSSLRVAALEKLHTQDQAVIEANKERSDRTSKWMLAAAAVATIANMLMGMYVLLWAH
jgi:hypothetical protein